MTDFSSPYLTEGQAIFVIAMMAAFACGAVIFAAIWAAQVAAAMTNRASNRNGDAPHENS